MKQLSFTAAEHGLKKKKTRREKFLAEMDRVIPWQRLINQIKLYYPTSGRRGHPPMGVPTKNYDRDSNVMEVFIGRLRRKLDPDGRLKPIQTRRGRGYRFILEREVT